MTAATVPSVWHAPLARRATPSPGEAGADIGLTVEDLAQAHGPAMLTVRRTASEDVQDRQVYLSLDGEDWATLYYGKEVTREIAPGRHVLKANNTLVRKSVTFDVTPGEHVRYQCTNKAHWTAMMFMAFLGAAVLTVQLVREPDGRE
ncbi:MAG: hypothetical protein R2745_00280 [Vicinamibacterales bacterium]